MVARTTTRGENAYLELKSDILAGRLLPGQRLQFGDLGQRYATSVGVLREALSRLAEQGLVMSEPQQGFRVTPVSPADLRDLTEARVDVETMAFRRALRAGDLTWESQLVAAHHVLHRTPQLASDDPTRVNEAWASAHAAFHLALLQACPNRRLLEIAASLRDASELYRRWSRHLGTEGNRDIPGEHAHLLEAALSRDVETAAGLLAAHIEYSPNAILAAGTLPLNEPGDITGRAGSSRAIPVKRAARRSSAKARS